NVVANMGEVGRLTLETSGGELGAGPLDSRAWRDAMGRVDIDAHIDLAKAASVLGTASLPLGEIGGSIAIQGHADRRERKDVPSLAVSARTQGLVIVGRPPPPERLDGTVVVGAAPWQLRGLDAEVNTSFDGQTGETRFASRLRDGHGLLASFQIESHL